MRTATSMKSRKVQRSIRMTLKVSQGFMVLALLLAPGSAAAQQNPRAANLGAAHGARADENGAPNQAPADIAGLRLAPGFMVRLNVLDDPDFAGTFRVDEHGTLSVPILGNVRVEGETASEAEAQLRKLLLAGGFLKDPQIELTIVEFPEGEIAVLGEVARPGVVGVLGARKLVDVLALAGGTTVTAGNQVLITRGNSPAETETVHYSKASDPGTIEKTLVRPGDTVLVKRAGIVYVLGAVNRPSGIVMQEEGSLDALQAISLAGGTTQLASIGTIYLLRRQADHTTKVIALPYRKMTRGKSADDQLLAEDVLFVATNRVKMAYSDIQGVVNAMATVGVYAVAGY